MRVKVSLSDNLFTSEPFFWASWKMSFKKRVLTFMMFWVKVPVLSVQIWVPPPMVSEAWSFLTKLFSFFIYMTEKAREIVTARGSPSGTATTTTVIDVMKALIIAEMLSLLKKVVSSLRLS